jgi:hypothetical protein
MARLESVTAPLVIRFGDGTETVVAACFPHPLGVLYLDLFWHQRSPAEAAHLLRGELSGEGPWRVGEARIRVLGCHNTDPHLMGQFGPWHEYLEQHGDRYPPQAQILEIAARLGASVRPPDRPQ